MKEERYFFVPDAANRQELPEEEAQHALRVLRLGEGDAIELVDGVGNLYHATVSMAAKRRCFYTIDDKRPMAKTWQGEIRLAIAPTKMMERMEWMVEKATEIGFDAVSFVDCKFSERHVIKTDRVERIVISAMKQSRKPFKPGVNGIVDFKNFVDADSSDHKFIAHCYNDRERSDLFDRLQALPPTDSVSILVGPEGDFSVDEVDMAEAAGFEPVTLGNSRLRTETAGLMVVAMAQLTKRLK